MSKNIKIDINMCKDTFFGFLLWNNFRVMEKLQMAQKIHIHHLEFSNISAFAIICFIILYILFSEKFEINSKYDASFSLNPSVCISWEHRHFFYNYSILVKIKKWASMGKQYGGFSKKLQIELPYDSAIPLLGIYPTKTIIQKDTYTPCVHSSTIAKTWK